MPSFTNHTMAISTISYSTQAQSEDKRALYEACLDLGQVIRNIQRRVAAGLQ